MHEHGLFICLLCLFIYISSSAAAVAGFVWMCGGGGSCHVMTAKLVSHSHCCACVFGSVFSFCRLQQHTTKKATKTWSAFTIFVCISVYRKKCMFLLFQYIDQSIKAGTKFNLVACPNIVIMKGLGPFVPYSKRR